MSPGESQQRSFTVGGVFDIMELEPAETFIILAVGSADEPAGELSIELEADPDMDAESVMDYALAGFAFSPSQSISIITEDVSTPYSIDTGIAIEDIFWTLFNSAEFCWNH